MATYQTMMSGPKDTTSTGNKDPKKALEEIGRAQKAYQDYVKAGRQDLAEGAHRYAEDQRKLYTGGGGNAGDVAAGKDLTSLYKGSGPAGAYDENKAGQQFRTAAPTPKAMPTYSGPATGRPDMKPQMSYQDALKQANDKFDPLRQQDRQRINTQYQQDRLSTDQVAAARGGLHSGLVADQLTKLTTGKQQAEANMDLGYSSKAAELANALQKDDRNFNLQKWMADNANFTNDRNFGYQQYRDSVGDSRYDNQFDYQKYRDQVGDDRWQQQWDYQKGRDTSNDQFRDKQFDFQKALQEAGLTGVYNGLPTMQKQQLEQAMTQWYGNMFNDNYWNDKNFQNDQMMQDRNFGLQKINIISELNNLPATKAAEYLQNFVSFGVFSQDEANGLLRYWQNGQKVPESAVTNSSTGSSSFLDKFLKGGGPIGQGLQDKIGGK